MDQVLLWNIGMIGLKFFCLAAFVFLTIRTARRVYIETERSSLMIAFQTSAGGIIIWALVLVIGGYLMTVETAYRPKTEPSTTKSAGREVDIELPPLKESTKPPSWEEVQKANREENQKTREAFKELPKQE